MTSAPGTAVAPARPEAPADEGERRHRRRLTVRTTALLCAAVAMAHAGVWAVVTPPFQVIDEVDHVMYGEYLAQKGRVPRIEKEVALSGGSSHRYPDEYQAVLRTMPFSLEGKPTWSEERERRLRRQLSDDGSGITDRAVGGAARYPPLYYAMVAVPARLGADLDVLDRLFAMRLVSVLLAGVTVAFVYLFLRELLPSTPWAWAVGALAVAFQPVFGFMGGGVNNDNLLYAEGAALLFLLARGFRRGLTVRLGVGLGLVMAAGVLTKPTMIALVPPALAALAVMVVRARGPSRRAALRAGGAAVAALALPTLGWFVTEVVFLDRAPESTTGVLATAGVNARTTLRGQLSYLWQFFLPKLGFMAEEFPGYPRYAVWDVYIQPMVGRFGWFQYGFPMWANQLGLAVGVALLVLAGVGMARRRASLRRRWAELACYAAMLAVLLLLNGVAGYRFRALTGLNFEQPRYLFALLGLYGAVFALAARAAGPRWGRPLGVFLVVVAMGHSLLAVLLTIGRYYA